MTKRAATAQKTPLNTSAPTDSAKVSAPPAAPAVGDAANPAAVQSTPVMGEITSPSGDADGVDDGLQPAINIVAIEVRCEIDGFRRAGRAWSRQPVTVQLAELSDEQLLQLEAEPLLSVVYLSDNTVITAA